MKKTRACGRDICTSIEDILFSAISLMVFSLLVKMLLKRSDKNIKFVSHGAPPLLKQVKLDVEN